MNYCQTIRYRLATQRTPSMSLPVYLTLFSPSHLYSSFRAGLVRVFGFLPSQWSSGFWPYRLSPGLAISALVCLDFAFHLLSSVISLSWAHIYLAFAYVQTEVTLTNCLSLSHSLSPPLSLSLYLIISWLVVTK